jgi:hypothetical protein
MSRRWGKRTPAAGNLDWIDTIIFVLIALSLAVTAGTHGDWKLYVFGFKYDFLPLVVFLILRRVSWSQEFQRQLLRALLVVGGAIATYGVLTFFLPSSFFMLLGYSDLHSLYLPDASLAAFQQLGGSAIRRIQSTMSGPNQFGMWLLLPWSVAWVSLPQKRMTSYWLFVIGLAAALLFTFSRAAWIAATVIFFTALWEHLPRPAFRKVFLGFLGVATLLAIIVAITAPTVLWRFASTRDHLRRPLQALATMAENPFGLGLGMAGPASNRVSDACVYLAPGADASWASDRQNLCVFVGDAQIQPLDRACRCPLLPENWFLQIGVELGVAGLLLYITLIVLLLRRLHVPHATCHIPHGKGCFVSVAFLAFLGISIASFFLHAWEDGAVAYTLWILAAAVLNRARERGARAASP